MMTTRAVRLLAAAALVVFGVAVQASADPISITSGEFFYLRDNPTRFSLAWSGGSLSAIAGDTTNPDGAAPWPAYACNFCTSSAALDPSLDQEWTISARPGSYLQGTFVADGKQYTLKQLKFTIAANVTSIPNVPPPDFTTGTIRATSPPSLFTMRAQIVGMAKDINSSLLALTLFGRGTASVMFARDPGATVPPPGWFSSAYTFSQPSTPTPEPGTLLLITGGIGALLARRRKARHEVGA